MTSGTPPHDPTSGTAPPERAPAPRFALVLGSGGIAGGAFHAGVLKAMDDVLGLDARDAEVIVGTSAGALTGALVTAGLSGDDIFRRETHKPLSSDGAELLEAARAHIGERFEPAAGLGGPAAPELLTRFAFQPWAISPGTVAAGMLPRGKVPTSAIADLVEGLHGDRWPHRPRFEVVTVGLADGHRKVFSEDSDVPLPAAVAASCAVPGVYAPVSIGGADYFDGGVHSSDNLDVVARHDVDLVIVSSPMSTQRALDRPGVWTPLRVLTRVQTELEAGRLPADPPVVALRPGPDDLDAMGANLLDPRRRPTVAMQAYTTASDHFRALQQTKQAMDRTSQTNSGDQR